MSGHDLVRQLEQLPVDRNSRPLQDAAISNCGELIRQVKGKSSIHSLLSVDQFSRDSILLICSEKGEAQEEIEEQQLR